MFEIDPKLLENVEKQLNIGSLLKFIIGFTDKYFVIAKRGGIQSVAKTEQEDPLKPGESRFVNVHTFSVIELPEGGALGANPNPKRRKYFFRRACYDEKRCAERIAR